MQRKLIHMIRRIDLRASTVDPRSVLPRAEINVDAVTERVAPIILDVRERGSEAVLDWSARLDGVRPVALRVPAPVIADALASVEPAVQAALNESIRRARIVHTDQARTETVTSVVDGGTVTERWVPVDRVGLYVPGGNAVYPSSVIMNVVPAQVAGVPSIAVASPPQPDNDGWPHASILAACALLGIDEIYAAGGAQAIAMLAHGTEDCVPVDIITGPGNVYVTAAKRLLRGVVGIDSEAGPTEVAILADDSANAAHVAADLISQAEHDTLAAAVLVTDSADLATAVDAEIQRQVAQTKHQERITDALGGSQSAIVLVDDMAAGIRVVDAYAAEHLEIHTRTSAAHAREVRHAGAIFVGTWAPVSLGDYCAGSNHVLPTGGAARHASGLSVQTFLRGIHIIEYDETAFRGVADHVMILAEAEDLPGHGDAIRIRLADA